jgi:general L-amino acid transport system permease protein
MADATAVAQPRAPGPPGLGGGPALNWIRANLFASWGSSILTIVLLYAIVTYGWALFEWAVVKSTVFGSAEECREIRGQGACWSYIREKYRFNFFGTYPFAEQWRPALAIVTFIGLYGVSTVRGLWNWRLGVIWLAGLFVIAVLMWGGVFGLTYVEQERWGGLPLTLILATFGIAFAFPLSILLALGRRSHMPAIKAICVGYIELIRGVPLVSLLFMASVMFPLFLPEGLTIDKLLRAQVAIILFAAAYLAEVVRGGLQALPKGQYEAADALGLSYWKKTGLIILPQALRLVIPPLVNTFIGLFKDTSLVVIIGLFDLLNSFKGPLAEPAWQGNGVVAYVAVSAVYFVFCYAMSKYSQGIEAEFNRHRRR